MHVSFVTSRIRIHPYQPTKGCADDQYGHEEQTRDLRLLVVIVHPGPFGLFPSTDSPENQRQVNSLVCAGCIY